MKHIIVISIIYSLLSASVSVGTEVTTDLDTDNGLAVTMDELRVLEGDNWEGNLSYLNYGSDKRSTIPVKVAIEVLDEKALQYAIQYPGEEQHNAKEQLKLSADGTKIDGYAITKRKKIADGTLILTTEGAGQDNNRPAEVQVVYTVAANRFKICKNIRFDSSGEYFNRNEYNFLR